GLAARRPVENADGTVDVVVVTAEADDAASSLQRAAESEVVAASAGFIHSPDGIAPRRTSGEQHVTARQEDQAMLVHGAREDAECARNSSRVCDPYGHFPTPFL